MRRMSLSLPAWGIGPPLCWRLGDDLRVHARGLAVGFARRRTIARYWRRAGRSPTCLRSPPFPTAQASFRPVVAAESYEEQQRCREFRFGDGGIVQSCGFAWGLGARASGLPSRRSRAGRKWLSAVGLAEMRGEWRRGPWGGSFVDGVDDLGVVDPAQVRRLDGRRAPPTSARNKPTHYRCAPAG